MATAATHLLLVRHGQTDWNAEGRIQGIVDTPLSALGREQAAELAARLAAEPIDAIVSSDLVRARETAAPLAQARGLEVRAEPRLRERAFGIFEGHTYSEVEANWPSEFAIWRRREPGYAVPGGESYLALRARVLACLGELVADNAGQSVLVVTHGGVLDAVYRAALGISWETPRSHRLPNAGVNRVRASLPGPALEVLAWQMPAEDPMGSHLR
jgi:probable phosphoglycerate mutase